MDYLQTLKSLPNSLVSADRKPNLPLKRYTKWDPFQDLTSKKESFNSNIRREYADENNLSSINMSEPKQVLPNGNVVMSNNAIVPAQTVDVHSNASNSNSTPVQQMSNGSVRLSNGNTVSPVQSNTPAIPVAINGNKDVVMSNGNTVAKQNVAMMPQQSPNAANTAGMVPRQNSNTGATMNGANYRDINNNSMNSGSCPIAPPARSMRYCRPAPFHSSNGERYFFVEDAYGKSVSQ